MSQIKPLCFALYKQILISKGRGILQLSSEIYSFLADNATNRKKTHPVSKLLREVNTSLTVALNANPYKR